MPVKFTAISLFSGAMGLDLGLEQAGAKLLLANEIDKGAVETIKINRPKVPVIAESVAQVTAKQIASLTAGASAELDLLCGGPPCQSYSVYGNRAGAHDPRGQLVFEFVRLVRELRPKIFLMENVRGLHSMPFVPSKAKGIVEGYQSWMAEKGTLLKELVKSFQSTGYAVDVFLVNSVNYGAPQIRERMFIMGNRIGVENLFPEPTHSNRNSDNLKPFATLRDAIGEGFVDKNTDLMNFSARKLKYLAMVPEGGNWRSLPVEIQKESMGKSWYLKGGRSATWRRLSWDFPSPTVVTMPNHASTSMCHPSELRALTVGECAAIQEFPPNWKFVGATSDKYRQIGNAVPTRLGFVAGKAIKSMLSKAAKGSAARELCITDNVIRIHHIRPHVRTKRYWHNGEALAGDHDYYDEHDLPLFA